MNSEQMQELVKESGLDWHRGYMPLFDGDPTNRYAVLIEAVVAAERERWTLPAAMAVQELAHCATWTAGGVACKSLQDVLRA